MQGPDEARRTSSESCKMKGKEGKERSRSADQKIKRSKCRNVKLTNIPVFAHKTNSYMIQFIELESIYLSCLINERGDKEDPGKTDN